MAGTREGKRRKRVLDHQKISPLSFLRSNNSSSSSSHTEARLSRLSREKRRGQKKRRGKGGRWKDNPLVHLWKFSLSFLLLRRRCQLERRGGGDQVLAALRRQGEEGRREKEAVIVDNDKKREFCSFSCRPTNRPTVATRGKGENTSLNNIAGFASSPSSFALEAPATAAFYLLLPHFLPRRSFQ